MARNQLKLDARVSYEVEYKGKRYWVAGVLTNGDLRAQEVKTKPRLWLGPMKTLPVKECKECKSSYLTWQQPS
jgi:hypothetical protein